MCEPTCSRHGAPNAVVHGATRTLEKSTSDQSIARIASYRHTQRSADWGEAVAGNVWQDQAQGYPVIGVTKAHSAVF